MKLLGALVFLAFHLLMLLFEKVKRLFTGGKKGEEAFLAQFAQDGYFPFSLTQRTLQNHQSECFQCGLCASLQSLQEAVKPLPQQLFSSTTRHLPEIELWNEELASLENVTEEFEGLCPAGLSPREIRDFVEAKSELLS